jgi:hypothetical protein
MSKRLLVLAMTLGVCGVAACDDGPNEPEGPPNTIVFTSSLSAANEVPAVTGAEISTTGTATITLNLTRDSAGAITAATANFSSTLSNMPAGTTLILAHIHPGAAGATGSPVVNTGLTAAAAIPAVNGSATLTFNNVTIASPATAQSIIDNPAAFYFNVHSQANPSGVARGQLVRQNP